MEFTIDQIKFYGDPKNYKSLEDAVERISAKHFKGNHKKEIESQIAKHYGSDRPVRNAKKAEKSEKGSQNDAPEGDGKV